jgi:hypothetical protein
MIGLILILALNALLLRTSLVPLDRLAKRMGKLELHQPIETNLGRAVAGHESGLATMTTEARSGRVAARFLISSHLLPCFIVPWDAVSSRRVGVRISARATASADAGQGSIRPARMA